jgi:hypothetical protein
LEYRAGLLAKGGSSRRLEDSEHHRTSKTITSRDGVSVSMHQSRAGYLSPLSRAMNREWQGHGQDLAWSFVVSFQEQLWDWAVRIRARERNDEP